MPRSCGLERAATREDSLHCLLWAAVVHVWLKCTLPHTSKIKYPVHFSASSSAGFMLWDSAAGWEYIRLLEQALSQLGFDGAARHLEQESGIALEAPEIGRLRHRRAGGRTSQRAVALARAAARSAVYE